MFAKRCLVRVAGLAALVLALGCSRGGIANLATVSGTVTHNGVPIDGAKVVLHSTAEAAGQKGNSYAATTDSSGKYLIVGLGKEPGIPSGMYKVTVVRLDLKGTLPTDGMDAGQMEASGMSRNLLPKDYEDPARTKLSVTLEPGKNENKNFDLKGQASNTKAPQGVP